MKLTIDEIIKIGTAPGGNGNHNNTTIEAGKRMCAVFAALKPAVTVDGVYINTTTPYPAEAAMIAAEGLDIPADTRLYLHVQMEGPGRGSTHGVGNFWRAVKSSGLHDVVVLHLDTANPDWQLVPDNQTDIDAHQKMIAAVAALPGIVPDVVVPDVPPPLPPAAAMPDWDLPVGANWLGVRVGDNSPWGTTYTSPAGVVWTKKAEQSPFGMMNARWERAA